VFRNKLASILAPITGWGLCGGLILLAAAGCSSISANGKNSEGVRLFNQANYEESLRRFQAAAYRNPDNADAYYNLGATCHRLGTINQDPAQLAQAESYYNQCLDKDENHTECYRGLAVLLVQQDRSEESFRLLEGWVDRQPELADAKIELARLYDEFGEPETAKDRLLEALAVDHQNPRALAALGSIREQSGEYAQALSNYRQSLAYDSFQQGVASRVAALQPAAGTSPTFTSPAGPTRLVNAAPPTMR
jgi:tetratricopeptide (TPR) repeat protein